MEHILAGMEMGIWLTVILALFFGIFKFTFIEESKAKAITKFKRFHKIKMSFENHIIDDNGEVVESPVAKKPPFGGLKLVGIRFIHNTHKYNFQYTSWKQTEDDKGVIDKPVFKDLRGIDYILVQDDVYYALLDKAECKDKIPLNITLLLTLKVVNPYKALFSIQNWLETVINRVKPSARRYVGTKSYQELISEEKTIDVATELFEQLAPIREEIKNVYGVELLAIEIPTIDPGSKLAEEFIESSTRKYMATQKKQEIEELAEAEVSRVGKVYKEILSHGKDGEDGLKIKALEAISESGKSNGNWVIAPGIDQLIKGFVGSKTKQKEEE